MCKTSADCLINGHCVVNSKGVSCVCDAGFTGNHCEVVLMWAALEKGAAACTSECNFVLAAGFTTPVEGFKHIHIGDPQAVTMGKTQWTSASTGRGRQSLMPTAKTLCSALLNVAASPSQE
jgi:hypothetical protein